MARPRIVLIASPFVSASSWALVANMSPGFLALDYGGVRGPDWYGGVAARIVEKVDGETWIGALHSGAGGFAPALAAAARRLAGLIFVDAALPYPGRSWLEAAPQALADRLPRMARGGILPPWNEWFARDPTARLFADDVTREAFVRDLPRVPFAFLDARSPSVTDWENLPVAYLQLSRAYAEEAATARARGWPTRTADLHHLAMMTQPAIVARLVADLAEALA
ncbi:MAG: alpha/beta fold hydrolase [Caulobacteraceae bacterium]|nr:alpha/beta fold hydrolase [Caulobacteraceae bacterium]